MTSSAAMSPPPDGLGSLTGDEVAALEAPVRRFVASRVGHDPHQVDDIVQETLTRTLAAADVLEIETLSGYAIAISRNEIAAHHRAAAVSRRHLPRLLDRGEPETPPERATASESRAALATALAALPDRDRRLLIAHDLQEESLAELARREKAQPGALATRLHRARARLRVDYVVALRRARLLTPRCRPVLLAISAGDTRQQRTLQAGEHLASCHVCDDLALPLLNRDRTLAAVVPWLPIGTLHGAVERWIRDHPRGSVAAAGAAAAAAALGVVTVVHPSPPEAVPVAVPAATEAAASPAPLPPVPGLSSNGTPVIPAARQLTAASTVSPAPVVAAAAPVLSVPGDEGFWVGNEQARMWVQMTGSSESPERIVAGTQVSFTGSLVANSATFVSEQHLKNDQDRADLDALGIHIEVPARDVQVSP